MISNHYSRISTVSGTSIGGHLFGYPSLSEENSNSLELSGMVQFPALGTAIHWSIEVRSEALFMQSNCQLLQREFSAQGMAYSLEMTIRNSIAMGFNLENIEEALKPELEDLIRQTLGRQHFETRVKLDNSGWIDTLA